MQKLISENIDAFTDVTMEVSLSCGPTFHPITLTVNEFLPKTDILLYHHHLITVFQPPRHTLVLCHSAPVGLLGVESFELKKECITHINIMISNQKYVAQVTAGESSTVCRDILQSLHNYFSLQKV